MWSGGFVLRQYYRPSRDEQSLHFWSTTTCVRHCIGGITLYRFCANEGAVYIGFEEDHGARNTWVHGGFGCGVGDEVGWMKEFCEIS